MMRLKKILIAFTMISCSNYENNPNDNFLKEFKDDDFTKFRGNSFFVRGFDEDNPIIFVYSTECKQPLVITANRKTNTILKVSRHLQTDICRINTTQKETLTLSFLKYNVNYLKVDENLDVYINTMFEEGPPRLVRFSNSNNIKGNWEKIVNDWYISNN